MLCHGLHHAIHEATAHDLAGQALDELRLQAAVVGVGQVQVLIRIAFLLAGDPDGEHGTETDVALHLLSIHVVHHRNRRQVVLVVPMLRQGILGSVIVQVVLVLVTNELAVRSRQRVAGDSLVGSVVGRQEQHHGVAARIVHQVRGQHIGAGVVTNAVRRTSTRIHKTSERSASGVVAVLQRRTAGAAVRHHYDIHNLRTVLPLKLLDHLHRSHERVVKRRIAKSQPIRERRNVETPVGLAGVHAVRQHPQLLHRILVGRTVHGAAGEVVQEERRVSRHTGLGAVGDETLGQVLVLGGFGFVLHRPTIIVVVTVVLVAGLVAAEGIHIERHTDATEERGERVHLLHHIQDHPAHRTRPIQQEDEPVVLAVGLDREVLEQVLVPLVGGQEAHVQRTRLRILRTVVSRRCLLQHERLDHRIHGGLGLADEPGKFATGFGQPLTTLGAVTH